MDAFLQQIAGTSVFEWVGMLSGIVAVWLGIKEKTLAWPCFILCYACYIYISYDFGLVALTGMNLIFIGLSLYGWVKWSRLAGKETEIQVSHIASRHWPIVIAFICVGTLGLGWLLTKSGGATQPYWDAFATSCAFTAQWMLGRKHIETWIFWIASDLVYIALFAIGGLWPTVILFTIFTGLAIKGWLDWSQSCLLDEKKNRDHRS